MTFELDLDGVQLNQRAKYLGQRSFRSKVTFRQTHITDRLLYLDHTVDRLPLPPCANYPIELNK